MLPGEAGFKWSEAKERAACQLAEDRLSDDEIATDAGVTRMTLARWKVHPEFAARIDHYLEEFRRTVRRRGIAIVENRVDSLNDRWKRLKQVIEERGQDLAGECPGGATGLLVRQYKSLGSGDASRVVEEYQVDTGLLREMREHEKQAAQELGQWAETKILSGPDGKPLLGEFAEALKKAYGDSDSSPGDGE